MGNKILVGALSAALTVATAPVAAADGNTQAFIDAMYGAGFMPTMGTESFWVLDAARQCRELDHGLVPADAAKTIAEVNPQIPLEAASTFVTISMTYFCPAHLPPPAAGEHNGEQLA